MNTIRAEAVPWRRHFLVVGVVSLCLLGYAVFSGSTGSAPAPEDAAAVVALAKADLALRIGIDQEQIAVVSVKAVTWPDTGLGCPEPGMFYAQVLTPGYRILLSHAGVQYTYHSDQARVVYCPGKDW